jgi:hypothetical protein
MPIRINLLSEALAEEDLRRRDPVKRALFVGIFLLALMLAWYSSIWLDYKLTQQNLSRVQAEILMHTNDYSQVQISLKRISDGNRKLGALQQLHTNRFLQGNFMNALQQVYVPGVQVMRVKLDQLYVCQDSTPDKTNQFGVVRGKPGSSTQIITLTLDAKDSSSNPGDQVNYYKEAIAKQAYFRANLDATNAVKLASLSAAQIALDTKPFVMFTLECRFADKKR